MDEIRKYYQAFLVTGTANTEVLDTVGISPNGAGLTSTQAEPKTLLSILISTSVQVGNYLVVAIGQGTPVLIPDYVLHTVQASGTDAFRDTAARLVQVPCNIVIPEGETLRVGVRSGSTLSTINGAYVYAIGK